MKEILMSSDHLEDRVALLEDGSLAEIFIARGERTVGSIYKGKVANVLPGMQAAFIDIGAEKNAFLSLDDAVQAHLSDEAEEDSRPVQRISSIEQIVKPHQETIVQVIKEPLGAKGGRVTTNVSLPGRYMVLLPLANYTGVSRRLEKEKERERLKSLAAKIKPEGMGVIIRTAAEGKEEPVLRRELESLVKTWKTIHKKSEKARAPSLIHRELGLVDRALRDMFSEDVQKFMVDSRPIYDKVLEFIESNPALSNSRVYFYDGVVPLFEMYKIEPEIDKLLRKKVWLPSGGFLVIDPTEALTVIDVNTGKFVGTRSLDETLLKTNLESAAEIARQIRLRDISGIIVIDFIDMERKEDRRKLLAEFEQHLKKDRVRSAVFGMTSLGLVEMTRKRAGKNLDRVLREECFYCGGHGRVQSPETVAIRLEREIRRQALEAEGEALLVLAHPQAALNLAGWEGERLAALQKAVRKDIFLRGDSALHLEKYRLLWDDAWRIKENLRFLREDEVIEEEIQAVHPINPQSACIFVDGQILEIVNGGNRAGEKARIRVAFVSPSYALGEILL